MATDGARFKGAAEGGAGGKKNARRKNAVRRRGSATNSRSFALLIKHRDRADVINWPARGPPRISVELIFPGGGEHVEGTRKPN